MYNQWMIKTHGDPLGAVRELVRSSWTVSNLEGMIISTDGDAQGVGSPRLLENPEELEEVNPFKPLMTENTAKRVYELICSNPGNRYGALLRPCEMRALVEMVKHDSFEIDELLTISVDCLGTFPADEYQWRAARKESTGGLTKDTLKFAKQGGIMAYRYRSACQMCVSPAAREADLNVNIFGLPVRQHILIQTGNRAISERLHLDQVTDGKAQGELVIQHERVLARMSERHRRTMDRVFQNLNDLLPNNVDELVNQLETCVPCQRCMEVCPICAVDFPPRGSDDQYNRQGVIRWLVSCAGCGMCEQACPKNLPLSTIFGYIRETLDREYSYSPGLSREEPLPIH